MKNVKILKQVLHLGQWVKPLPGGGPVLSVPDFTADHWIKTGAAEAASETPKPAPLPAAATGKKG
jgi:hypothetical protein